MVQSQNVSIVWQVKLCNPRKHVPHLMGSAHKVALYQVSSTFICFYCTVVYQISKLDNYLFVTWKMSDWLQCDPSCLGSVNLRVLCAHAHERPQQTSATAAQNWQQHWQLSAVSPVPETLCNQSTFTTQCHVLQTRLRYISEIQSTVTNTDERNLELF